MSVLLEEPATLAAPAPMGELSLDVALRAGRSVATSQYHRGQLRLLRPHYLDDTAQVCYPMINPGGAYLGGDVYRINARVRPGARLLLTTQSATKVYRTPHAEAQQHMDIVLDEGSSLEYLPDQLIAYHGASYCQVTTVRMAEDASLVMAEVTTPGWSEQGEAFSYDALRLRTSIHRGGRLLAVDNVLLRPHAAAGVAGLGLMEGYSHLGSMLVVDPRVDAALLQQVREMLEHSGIPAVAGLSLLNGPGFAVRALGRRTAQLDELFALIVNLLRGTWFGQEPLNLRKY